MPEGLPNRHTAIRFVGRLTLSAVCVVVLLAQWGDGLAQLSVPVLRWTYSQLDTDHQIREFSVSTAAVLRGSDKVFRLEVVPDGFIMVGTRVVQTRPDGWARVSVLTAYLWQSISVALVVTLAWPAKRRSEWAWRIVLLAIFCVMLALLDTPFVLWAQVWRNYANAFAPGEFSALLVWAEFLQRGGRFLLGALGAVAAIAWAAKLAPAHHTPSLKHMDNPARL
jgi:hypothetical protein